MAGYGYDTSTLTIEVPLPNGSTVRIVGDNDGVNGYAWSAELHSKPQGDPATVVITRVPVKVEEVVLIDGIEEMERS